VIYDAEENPTCADYAKVTKQEERKRILPAFIVTAFSERLLLLLRNSPFSTFIQMKSSSSFD
jgi:hypothetical protein